jgi:hypothetical protein
MGISQPDFFMSQESFNETHATLARCNAIGKAERRGIQSSSILEIKT